MIEVLSNQLLHLGDGILTAVRHVFRNIRDLGPDDHAALIAQIIEVLRMLVMRQTDGVGPHLADKVHVLQMFPVRNRIAEPAPVLVP